MAVELPLHLFVEVGKNYGFDKFRSDSVFFYLGTSLKTWLGEVLDGLGVPADGPLIRGAVATGAYVQGRVYIAEGAKVEPTAYIEGPCFIGPGAEIRHGAYIRGNVYIGKDAVVGHTSEVKGSILFDGAKAAHFAYVGDAILGRNVNLGAGTKLANLKLRGDEVSYHHPLLGTAVDSGLRKFSAILGDGAQTGCNAVLSPGTLLFPATAVMACVHYRGTLKNGIARGNR